MSLSPEEIALYVVDRFERSPGRCTAIVVSDGGRQLELPCSELPASISEGTVLRVAMTTGGPDWRRATPDPDETARRLRLARQLRQELLHRDPGGDLRL